MTCKVEQCWNGHYLSYRVLYPTYGGAYGQLTIRGDSWTRSLAKEAKDLLINVHGVASDRQAIRFQHR